MVPAVPFALLGVVQLVAVTGWVALAGAAAFPRLRRRTTPLVVAGALALAAADVVTAIDLGDAVSDVPSVLRTVGFLLLAVGLAAGALQPLTVALPAVVVPLGARPSVALAAAVSGVLAASAAVARSTRRGADRTTGRLVAAGLLVAAVAAALAAPARTSSVAAVAELVVRGVSTVVLLAAVTRLAMSNLLAKMIVAICAGAVAMAAATVGVVGPGLAERVQAQQARALVDQSAVEARALQEMARQASLFGQFVVECPSQPVRCRQFFDTFAGSDGWFAAIVRRGQEPVLLAHDQSIELPTIALRSLAGSSLVHEAFARGLRAPDAPAGPVVVARPGQGMVVAAAVPAYPSGYAGTKAPAYVAVYGSVVGDRQIVNDAQLAPPRGYGVTFLSGDGAVLGSSLRAGDRGPVLREARAYLVASSLPDAGSVVVGRGHDPTIAVYPTASPTVTLVVSRGPEESLAAQRSLLTLLFLTALLVVLVVSVLAVPLARRVADPVRRLTVAARRVRRGDLEGSTVVHGSDEVASLGRAFNEMTASLRALTADLRTSAEQEAALRARLETVVRSMSDGLVVTDAHGVVTAVNPAAADLLGSADGVGRTLAEVGDVRGEDGRRLLPPNRSRLEADATVRRPDGSEVPVRVGVAPLGDGTGGLVVVLHDVRREREVERLKTEFLSNISHELRTPLTPIRGYLEVLRRPGLPPEKVATYLDVIHESSVRMSRVVDLLVDVASLEAGRVEPRTRAVAVPELVDARLEAWRGRFPERAGDFRRKVAARLPDVDIDPDWVAKALDELADNAVKHTPPGTAITLLADRADAGDRVRVAVRDVGPGIEAERLPELLGDFSQADASATRRVGGMGLGLGFVRRVAAAVGLELDVRSRPGKGTEFALVLPVAVAPSRARRSGGGAGEPARGVRPPVGTRQRAERPRRDV